MQSTPLFRTALVCATVALTGPAMAQQLEAPDPGTLPVEAPGIGPGEPEIVETHRDWQILCNRFGEADEEQELCEMYQLLETEDGPIAEVSIAALPAGSQFPAGATITTPLETFLPSGLAFRIDAGQTRQEPFVVCMVIGCIARLGLSEEEVAAMRGGVNAFITIAPFGGADQPIEIPVSLMGFTAAFEDLQARMPTAE